MSEAEAKEQRQKPKVYKLAVWSLILGVISIIIPVLVMAFLCPGLDLLFFALPFTVSLGTIFGVISIFKIWRSKGQLKGTGLAIGGIVISVIFFALFIRVSIKVKSMADQMTCGCNLSGLGRAMEVYSNKYNEYPTADKWCDLLIQYCDVGELQFVCKGGGEGRCHYAINPDCHPDSPNDVVLLFETSGGWNQFGGPELLRFNHKSEGGNILFNHKPKGCNILFNDKHVYFENSEAVWKLVKWKDGEKH